MSSTSKSRLQDTFGILDVLFAGAHVADRSELIKELRAYLSRQNSADARPAYDTKTNAATGHAVHS